jgi:ATP-dependent Zn protease
MDTFSVLFFTLFSPILGLGMSKKIQPTVETNVKFSDVKGVDEAKAELEEIVHFLKDPEVDFSGINLWSLLHAFLALEHEIVI